MKTNIPMSVPWTKFVGDFAFVGITFLVSMMIIGETPTIMEFGKVLLYALIAGVLYATVTCALTIDQHVRKRLSK